MGRLISLAHLTVSFEVPPPDVVTVAAATGFDAVGLRLSPSRINPTRPQEAQFPMLGDTPMMRETQLRLADTGLTVLDIEMVTLRADTKVDEFLPVLEAGARLSVKRVMVCGHDTDEPRVTALFAAMCDAAGAFGLGVDIEFMPWLGVKSLAQADRVVTNAGRPNGGILVDALHLHRSGAIPAFVAAVQDALAQIGAPRISLPTTPEKIWRAIQVARRVT